MKKINKIVFAAVCLANMFIWTGCSDQFLKDKTDNSSVSPAIYNDYAGAKLRVQDIYLRLLPNANDGLTYRSPSGGKSDIQSQSTEEFSGLSDYVNPDKVLTTSSNLSDWFYVSKSTSAGPWGEIRNCNDVIEGISGGTLSEIQKYELLGQVYFFRAWQYYLLVKTYGGIPIVDHTQAADVNEAQNLAVPRSTTKACIDFICSDLEKAASMLPYNWSSDFGRITKGAALALAGRARLLYASPLFNRADDKARWQLAYDANKAAIDTLTAGGFRLDYLGSAGTNAAGWSKIFSDYNSPEAVFVTLYNMVHDDNSSEEIYRNNHREQSLRPANAAGSGSNTGMSANALMVDLFPMADGKKPTEAGGTYSYNSLKFFENRDPRFYRTFAFPGVTWRFQGNPTTWTDYDLAKLEYYHDDGLKFALWNYAWYASTDNQTNQDLSGYGADNLASNYRGVYVRKRSNDFDMNTPTPTCLYRWPAKSSDNRQGAFGEGAMPHMEIRYAEVLLNFAEAACAIGKPAEAIKVLKDIRARAGYDAAAAATNYGLDEAALTADRGKLFGAILYERQIELAYEGKRFDDMRRWLLWDGGANFNQVNGAPGSWTLTGFGGNTCTYLGVAPFNGQRRDNIELRAIATAPEKGATATWQNNNTLLVTTPTSDPILANRPVPLDLKTNLSTQFAALSAFYDTYLVRKTRRGDQTGKVITFLPQYYIIGLTSGAQTNNITLLQTIGWADVTKGSINGTYDPLAE